MKILVAHRQRLVVDQIKSVLKSNHPVVIHSETGLDGLLTSRVEFFDLIICGTDLPVITGFELIRSIRTTSINKNVPVIFISDNVNGKTEHLSRALGAVGIFTSADVENNLPGILRLAISNHTPDRVIPDAGAL